LNLFDGALLATIFRYSEPQHTPLG
jgi:hypothetical protein